MTFVVATLLFALIFKVIPDADMRWRDLWVGAVFTAVLFVIGKALVAWYLQRANLGSSWGGATTSLIALLAWLYYTSLIVLLGAEFTQVWAREFGTGFQPTSGAHMPPSRRRAPPRRNQLARRVLWPDSRVIMAPLQIPTTARMNSNIRIGVSTLTASSAFSLGFPAASSNVFASNGHYLLPRRPTPWARPFILSISLATITSLLANSRR